MIDYIFSVAPFIIVALCIWLAGACFKKGSIGLALVCLLVAAFWCYDIFLSVLAG